MLYLHIGSPKAGSTSIQAFLEENRDRLPHGQINCWGQGNSWKIAASSGTHAARDFWVKRRGRLTEVELVDLAGQLWPRVRKQAERSPHDTFVASSEHIFTQLGSDQEAIERLRDVLMGIFGEVKLIVYLRDQVSYVKSLYAQRVKGPMSDTRSFTQYFEEFENLTDALCYADRIEKWESVFGKDRLDIGVFARDNFVDGNLIVDFLNRIDVTDLEPFLARGAKVENKSPSYSELNILRRLNRVPVLPRRKARSLASFVQGFLPEEDFPQDFDARILELVSEGNARLNDQYFGNMTAKLPVV